MTEFGPQTEASKKFHAFKYRAPGETFYAAMTRIASGLQEDPEHFQAFRQILLEQRFLPGGRIQSAIGSTKSVTAFNCYMAPTIADSFTEGPNSISKVFEYACETMRMGGGIGYDFSTLRPRGELIRKLDSQSSGPVQFMKIFDAACKCIASSGHRRGAQMGVLRVDHPDIEEFIHAKQDGVSLTNFNISVAVTDDFMVAVQEDKDFDLVFEGKVYKTIRARNLWESIMRSTWKWSEPGVLFIDQINRMNNLHFTEKISGTNPCVTAETKILTRQGHLPIYALVDQEVDVWNGFEWSTVVPRITGHNKWVVTVIFNDGTELECTPEHKFILSDQERTRVEAKDLKPGDSIANYNSPDIHEYGQAKNNLIVKAVCDNGRFATVYCFTEPKNHSGIFNGVLTAQCGEQPLGPHAACLLGSFNLVKYIKDQSFDVTKFVADIKQVVPAMDNVIDVSLFPWPQQMAMALDTRRMGLGVTGLANAGEALGHPYGSKGFIEFEDYVLNLLKETAYRTSIELAEKKGPFPLFDKDRYLEGAFIQTLPIDIQEGIAQHGIRNSHLISIAPTGTISLCADNVSSGIEPVFAYKIDRKVETFDGTEVHEVEDYGFSQWAIMGKTADQVTAQEHIDVLTTASRHVDSAVSKTCNVTGDMAWEDFKQLYMQAWIRGCKGCTTYNVDGERGAVLKAKKTEEPVGACYIDPQTGRKECE